MKQDHLDDTVAMINYKDKKKKKNKLKEIIHIQLTVTMRLIWILLTRLQDHNLTWNTSTDHYGLFTVPAHKKIFLTRGEL